MHNNKKKAEAFPDLSKTQAVGDDGKPLLLYRGETGVHSGNPLALQSKLGSYSFGDRRIANIYAGFDEQGRSDYQGNDYGPKEQRLYQVYLDIQNPVVNWKDPFIEYPDLLKSVGAEVALELLIKHQDHVFNTDNWGSNIDPDEEYGDVATVALKAPDLLEEIYLDIWPILDDPLFVNEARKRGFDGAIYNGTNQNSRCQEYRVFDASQVIFALTGERAEPEAPVAPVAKRSRMRTIELEDSPSMSM
jgi:hypothetical protein